MAKKLVIVESPAKARTIGSYLGSDYEVQASIGHIRDLMPNAKGLPAELRKKWWSDYAVDVDNDFEPFYEVPAEKLAQVRKLRESMKGKDTLVLATDEDREGEAISWHLLEVLKPGKTVKIKRIAFHEITKEAILRALDHPRDVDTNLVEAQETRRILDRLYGYTLSPVLWSRVTKNLSAGRVQSPAVKLIVEREILRRNFRSASYWDLVAHLRSDQTDFSAELKSIDGTRVANGSDFDDNTGELKTSRGQKVVLLDEPKAKALAEGCKGAKPWRVTRVEATEGQEKPAPPFMTTTLQQDANRKFGFSADRTMRIAQTLYEGVDLGGEQVGLITYMRTDSLTLSGEALGRLRDLIGQEYPDCLPDKPVHYTNKVKNAQEAHEAIRPTDVKRRPQLIGKFLSEDQLKLYTLIWQRTVACQMKPARVLRTEADITLESPSLAPHAKSLTFLSTGKQILFEGFLRVYSEGRDDDAADPRERKLPRLKEGLEVESLGTDPIGHSTKPPARYTDATLIKKLEELGIGRPSTYASIIAVIVDRGYVRKAGKQLIPSFKAFLTMEVLQKNFEELMDLGFTARMDEALDEISEGKANSKSYLKDFFLAEGTGLKTIVDDRKKEIPYPAFLVGQLPETGEQVLVRNGKDGAPFLQIGEEGQKRYANIPEDLAPADLTIEKAIELLNQKAAPAESVGFDPTTGRRLLLKNRQGFYLEVERTPEEIENKVKPTWISVPPGVDPRQLSQEELNFFCNLPKEIGKHPETNQPILFKVGKFGAYIESGEERRTVADWRAALTMTVPEAAEILSQPKFRTARAAPSALKEFGELAGAAGPVKVLSGRFGPYVTDGETNATLPRGTDPAALSQEQALELLARKREAGPSVRKPIKKKAPAKKSAAKPKAAAKAKK
ncbi:type I DNA topoisomerase [Fimbriimonas ginsengisoli]|uniref:DNA topoisomerase 1 n=1 Tax=Fimbriimonas ginsengisoli Gsoil 348 TaxID=661478 RepID=A0A068NTH1_FIMGI|nr:type I DNA topoisomerase [Fimbriimonas ginsengisoli]AIE86741.1 DNA topoisomerase I [Fimbriimonas ginsengisoli Gsoil 348]